MKGLVTIFLLISGAVSAQSYTETYKLPEGTTYRARMAGFDCGTFGSTYVSAPDNFKAKGIEFKQLSADKDLNKFLIEAYYPGADGNTCIQGIFLDRNRDSKTLDFTHSLITVLDGGEENCGETRSFIEQEMASVAYEGSKRGIRYIAVEIVKDTPNSVCETRSVRAVFDRRFTE